MIGINIVSICYRREGNERKENINNNEKIETDSRRKITGYIQSIYKVV